MEKSKKKWLSKSTPYIYIAPFFIGFITFSLYPTLYAFWLSFHEWSGTGDKIFIGLDNYIEAFQNRFFFNSLIVSARFMLITPIATFFALVLAFLLGSKKVFKPNIYKFTYLMPFVAMPVTVGVIFRMLLGWDHGIINRILYSLGIISENINWLGEARFTFFAVALLVTWRFFGYHMVIYLGGLMSIDTHLYEAARIDGASAPQIFSRITIPLLKPYIVLLLMTGINGSMNLFDEPMTLYAGVHGGPEGAARTIGLFNYFIVFISHRWGFGSATSFITFCIVCILSVLLYKLNYAKGMER